MALRMRLRATAFPSRFGVSTPTLNMFPRNFLSSPLELSPMFPSAPEIAAPVKAGSKKTVSDSPWRRLPFLISSRIRSWPRNELERGRPKGFIFCVRHSRTDACVLWRAGAPISCGRCESNCVYEIHGRSASCDSKAEMCVWAFSLYPFGSNLLIGGRLKFRELFSAQILERLRICFRWITKIAIRHAEPNNKASNGGQVKLLFGSI